MQHTQAKAKQVADMSQEFEQFKTGSKNAEAKRVAHETAGRQWQ